MALNLKIALSTGAAIALAFLLFFSRNELAHLFLPWLRFVIGLLENTYYVETLEVLKNKHELVFHLRLMSEGPVTLYGRSFPRMDVSATTLVTHLITTLYIFLLALLVAPLFKKLRLVVFIPLIAISLLITTGIDIPFVLLGSIEGLILENLAPEKLDGDFLVKMERLMNNGGRMGIALGLSLLAGALSLKDENRKIG